MYRKQHYSTGERLPPDLQTYPAQGAKASHSSVRSSSPAERVIYTLTETEKWITINGLFLA